MLGSNACGGVAKVSGDYWARVKVAIEIPYVLANPLSYDRKFGNVESRQVPCQPEPCPNPLPSGTVRTDCYTDRDELGGGGGGGTDCVDCVTEPVITYCRVRYWYWKDTGEIFAWNTLFCA